MKQEQFKYKGYTGVARWNSKDTQWEGKVHGTKDLITFEGFTVKEARKAFEEAIEDYLETEN